MSVLIKVKASLDKAGTEIATSGGYKALRTVTFEIVIGSSSSRMTLALRSRRRAGHITLVASRIVQISYRNLH